MVGNIKEDLDGNEDGRITLEDFEEIAETVPVLENKMIRKIRSILVFPHFLWTGIVPSFRRWERRVLSILLDKEKGRGIGSGQQRKGCEKERGDHG